MKAEWNGSVLAESDSTIVIEGNHYFPQDSLRMELFRPSAKTTFCGWKGTASYYDVVVGEETNPAAAWYYAEPMEAAAEIREYVAFGGGVAVRDS